MAPWLAAAIGWDSRPDSSHSLVVLLRAAEVRSTELVWWMDPPRLAPVPVGSLRELGFWIRETLAACRAVSRRRMGLGGLRELALRNGLIKLQETRTGDLVDVSMCFP